MLTATTPARTRHYRPLLTLLAALCAAGLGLGLLPSAAVAESVNAVPVEHSALAPTDPSSTTDAPLAARRGADYHRPKNGTCHRLNRKQAYKTSDSRRPVPCSGRHTTQTVRVFRLPKRIDVDSRSDRFDDYVARRCLSATYRALGRNDRIRSQSSLDSYFFRPTRAEQRRGARWIRCDVAVIGDKLLPLPQKLRLPRALPKKLTRCLSRGKLNPTSCARPHSYRAIGAITYRSKKYPRFEEIKRAAQRCRRFVGRRAFRWSYADWYAFRSGSRALVCYKTTKK